MSPSSPAGSYGARLLPSSLSGTTHVSSKYNRVSFSYENPVGKRPFVSTGSLHHPGWTPENPGLAESSSGPHPQLWELTYSQLLQWLSTALPLSLLPNPIGSSALSQIPWHCCALTGAAGCFWGWCQHMWLSQAPQCSRGCFLGAQGVLPATREGWGHNRGQWGSLTVMAVGEDIPP